MGLGPPGRRQEPLNVVAMALALVFAAFVGAAAGLLWHASGLSGEEEEAQESSENERLADG